MDGKPKPAVAVGGRGMCTSAARPMVSTSPKAIAPSQCAAACQRRRHSSHSIAAAEEMPSTGALPSAARVAIRRSASGLRSANISSYTRWSSADGPPAISSDALKPAHSHATRNRQAASSSSEADSGRRESISGAAQRLNRGCARTQRSARASRVSACAANQRHVYSTSAQTSASSATSASSTSASLSATAATASYEVPNSQPGARNSAAQPSAAAALAGA